MPYSFHHLINENCVFVRFYDTVTVDEVVASFKEVFIRSSVSLSSKIICDLTAVRKVVATLDELKELAALLSSHVPCRAPGLTAVVAENDEVIDITRLIYHLSGAFRDIKYFSSVPEARDWLDVSIESMEPEKILD
jgi:hypothetical protein